MNLSKVYAVYRKEIKDTLRDRRTVMSMILIPIVLYPLLFSVVGQIMSLGAAKLEQQKNAIVVKPGVPDSLINMIESIEKIEIVASDNPEGDLQARKIAAIIDFNQHDGTDSIKLYYDAAVDRSRLVKGNLADIFSQYKTRQQETNLKKEGVDASLLYPVGVRFVNTASPSRMGGSILGGIIPMLLIITLALGAMYPAIDLTAGEKERGTLETILTVPIARSELLTGKFMTVFTIALITGILNLFSMILTYSLGLIQLGVLSGKIDFALSASTIIVLFIMLIPLALFISAALISVCLFARSFKDAQNLITPFYFVLIFPTFFAMAPGIELNAMLALIPILNICLLFKELILGGFAYDLIFSVFLSNALFAFLGILVVSRLFNAEKILFAEGKGLQFSFNRSKLKARANLAPSESMLLFAILMVLLIYLGSLSQLKFGYWGLLFTEYVLILLPVLLFLRYGKVNFKSALSLNGFHPIALVGTLLLAFGGLHIVAWFAQIQADWFPEMIKVSENLEKLLNFEKLGLHPVVGLLMFAVTPAICEEILFRGAILSSLKARINPTAAVLIVALLFGIFHLNLFRIVPAALLGSYLTFITYRTGSIYLSMIAHALNNGFALLVVAYPGLASRLPWLTDLRSTSWLIFAGVFLITITGALLVYLPKKVAIDN